MSLYIIFFILLIPFSYTPLFVFLFLALFVILIEKIRFQKLEVYELFFIFYFLFSFSTIIISGDIQRAFNLVLFNALLIISYVAIISYIKNINIIRFFDRLYVALKLYVYISIILFIMGVIAYYVLHIPLDSSANIFGLHVDDIRPRFNGLATSPSTYGLIAMGFLLLGITTKKITSFNIVLVLLTMFLTISWTVYLTFFSTFIIYSLLKKKYKILFSIVFSITTFIGLGVYFINTNEVLKNIIEYRIDNLMSGTHRFQIWEMAFNSINEYLLLGRGYNYTPVFLKEMMGENSLSSLHNVFVQLLFEQGLVGVILFFLFFFSALFKSFKVIKYNENTAFLFYWMIVLFIQMNAAIVIYSPNFLLFFIILKKITLTQQQGNKNETK